jgi:5-oxoprolinase (ATP-hydrolysing)
MEGGGPGAFGRNTWVKQPRNEDGDLQDSGSAEPRYINIGGKATVWMGKGDRLLIETPGGGAWGARGGDSEVLEKEAHSHVGWAARGSLAERTAAQAGF